MSEFIHNKTSGNLVTVLIGLIVLSFMFTGYQTFENGGSTNAVGKVGSKTITPEEYENEYRRQMEFFKSITGSDLTAKQMEEFKIKEAVLRNLVQKKIMITLSEDLGAHPSQDEIKKEIKALPYFKTNDQFDLEKYKGLLAANRLSPQDFEADIANQMKMKKLQSLFANYPLSENYLNDLKKFREDKLDAKIITISKNDLRKLIPVSSEETTKFLADQINVKRIESMFNERKDALSKPEEVTAKHILLTTQDKNEKDVLAKIESIAKEVTPANFKKLADKYTEDPSGKGKGGDLGSFSKGRMVPEFEAVAFTQAVGTISKPVKTSYGYHIIFVEKKTPGFEAKFENFKNNLAKEMIQKDKVDELKKMTVDISNNLKAALEKNDEKTINAIVAANQLKSETSSLNKLDGLANGATLSADNVKQAFSNKLESKVFLNDDGNVITMIKTIPTKTLEADKDLNALAKATSDNEALKNVLSRKMLDSIMKKLEAETKVKIYSNSLL